MWNLSGFITKSFQLVTSFVSFLASLCQPFRKHHKFLPFLYVNVRIKKNRPHYHFQRNLKLLYCKCDKNRAKKGKTPYSLWHLHTYSADGIGMIRPRKLRPRTFHHCLIRPPMLLPNFFVSPYVSSHQCRVRLVPKRHTGMKMLSFCPLIYWLHELSVPVFFSKNILGNVH